ncbi:MAG: lysophospholipid acyltransferase family protein [Proteobacteria bacterium]|nr:lysophospholipid acyltransferase family protein [Pseudomonadota bacterium]
MKKIRYLLEAIIVKFGIWFFGSLRMKTASNLAARIAQFVGKKISVHKLAYKNLSNAMPELSAKEKENILDDMWDNLGRIVGEFPHVAGIAINKKDKETIEVSQETLDNIAEFKKSGGGIIISAHIGNWEVGQKFFLQQGLQAGTVYRPLNNPYVEKMTASIRKVEMIEKNSHGNRRIIELIKAGGTVVILADQKVSEGEPIKFFHADAITTTSIARIALRYKVPIVPARIIRIGKEIKFRAELEKPLAIPQTPDVNLAILDLSRAINHKLEQWITEYPSQWFWVHDRWKK